MKCDVFAAWRCPGADLLPGFWPSNTCILPHSNALSDWTRAARKLAVFPHRLQRESTIRVLVVRAEGPDFSFGGEVREWPGKDVNWFRTFVAEVNASYRAIEALRVPTMAVVQGVAFGGGFELALACDFLVAAKSTVFRCVEVTMAMLPIAGALQRLAERVGRARAALLDSAYSAPGADLSLCVAPLNFSGGR